MPRSRVFAHGRATVRCMSNEERGEDRDTGDAQVALRTGIRDQRMVVSGWFASHANSGTRGPHVHLDTNDGKTPVLRTSQIPELVDALNVVGERIDRLWETDGADYPFGEAPDDNDPPSSANAASTSWSSWRTCARTSLRWRRSCCGPKTCTTLRPQSRRCSASTSWK